VLSSFVPSEERLITIEDAAELRLAQPHVIGLEARPATVGCRMTELKSAIHWLDGEGPRPSPSRWCKSTASS
jgi:type IV secretory pathway ATPase VirB11/archaellum biosynthesis ATPase